MIASTLISQIGDLPLDTVYLQNVVARYRYFSLTNGMAFVIADCSKTGQLNSRYCLLEKLTFSSTNSDCKCTVMVCSCDHGLEQKAQAGSNIKGDLRRIGCLSSARSQTVLRSLTYCSQVSQYRVQCPQPSQ